MKHSHRRTVLKVSNPNQSRVGASHRDNVIASFPLGQKCPRKITMKLWNYQSSPSLTILVPSRYIIISMVFFYLCKVLLSSFLQFNGNFVDGQNNSKYHECAPLRIQYRIFPKKYSLRLSSYWENHAKYCNLPQISLIRPKTIKYDLTCGFQPLLWRRTRF